MPLSFQLPAMVVSSSFLMMMMLLTLSMILPTEILLLVDAQPQDSSTPSSSPSAAAAATTLSPIASPPTLSAAPSEFPSAASMNRPSPAPTIYVPTRSAIPSDSPSAAPTRVPSVQMIEDTSTSPTFENIEEKEEEEEDELSCKNTAGWMAPATYLQNGQWIQGIFDCDHPSISCQRRARIGPATQHCCKCRPECCGQCSHAQPNRYDQAGAFSADPCNPGDYDDDDYSKNGPYIHGGGPTQDVDDESSGGPMEGIDILRFIFSAMGITFCVIAALLAIRNQQSRELRDARRIMAERRRLQREREEGEQRRHPPEQLDMNARFDQIVASFLFQSVNSDKTNISADCIRGAKAATAGDGGDDEAPVNEDGTSVSASTMSDPSNTNENSLTERLSSWTKPSPKDECCICLECYAPGETICVPICKDCNHVFHEECIVEWLKNHTDCPLCRVQVLGDRIHKIQ
ncbi:unnamed protein product [Cylindrotheca closterium]|uniref:RING-type domain-containing protein n=1 Tax=Cylindrotheca closterium TaxID=2856 RepID=A0AAD2JJN6_9STRA|nr:unnamed protein product [Cylindrotheca closterium]